MKNNYVSCELINHIYQSQYRDTRWSIRYLSIGSNLQIIFNEIVKAHLMGEVIERYQKNNRVRFPWLNGVDREKRRISRRRFWAELKKPASAVDRHVEPWIPRRFLRPMKFLPGISWNWSSEKRLSPGLP
jgi:hypothetical protein